ncbi:aminotransferase class III-fold pyridoxal phosphate-dependent enzyme [Kordia sp.]|uniref:aspartate aminotransferase family protein n=1 Tax=Kordia sp. TaxID=1965332 RepID=UPI0025BF3713|nr:aminotransferase class III-fold pyridoxal phosphate-dependent enzyme [Kordia sp.]MCH2193525.1 aminotransferase class III-fold pyridoxal phosphate-dependent enzyme [Kordia sp.]
MQTLNNEIAEKIISKKIEKKEAMRIFDSLSETDKLQLISQIKSLTGITDVVNGNGATSNRLKPLDQRDLEEHHRAFIQKLITEYENFVPKSKANVPKNHFHFVDQRRNFHLIKEIKQLHFQITYEKAEGAYVHDIDGNKYIDISGDMGVNIFGHKAPVIVDAVKAALDRGIPLAGYSETIHKATKLISELTGHDRVLFTQSGTEAVMVATRIARAATNRKKIALFEGAYHGLSDVVMAMRDMQGNSLAAGPGMLQEFADQIIVLKYGDEESLDIIEAHADEIAGVLVEPVQSRHIYNKPVEFLRELRSITIEKDIPLIFDEMITGFRVSPKGAQGIFNITPDISTYGKIPGGGLPTGLVAGSQKYMDLIDGGTWEFDDDSMPKSKRVGMGGTHSQNPLKVASAYATMKEIKRQLRENEDNTNYYSETSDCMYCKLNTRTMRMVEELNQYFIEHNLPITIDFFGSLFRFRYVDSYWGITEALMFILMRMNGVETNIQGNCFLTTAHTDEDIRNVIDAVKKSLQMLMEEGFFYIAPTEELEEEVFVETPIAVQQNKTTHKETSVSNSQIQQLKDLLVKDLKRFNQ